MLIQQLANKLIPNREGAKVLVKSNGVTKDIVAEVIQCFKDSRQQLISFAPHLTGNNLQQTLFNIWSFWKTQIKYKVDPDGLQFIQTPAALWQRKEGDCKSLSIAVMCCLHALGIKAAFRFTSYSKKFNLAGNEIPDYPTHVYVVVMVNGKLIPVDCVWHEYGTEKQFIKKWDYNMSEIYRLSGLEDNPEVGKIRLRKILNKVVPATSLFNRRKRRGMLSVDVNDSRVNSAVMDLALDKQRLEMEQIKAAEVHGIGSIQDNALEIGIAGIHNAMAALLGHSEVSINGMGNIPPQQRYCVGCNDEIDGIAGKAKRIAKKTAKAVKVNTAGKAVTKKQAKLLKKSGVAVKKVKEGLLQRVATAAKKVLTTPARIAIKATLPKNAPFFLYLYITDARVLAKLPEAVAIKRQKALDYKKKIVNGLQMPESNFDKTVRNGIMNAFAKSPEAVLADWMKQAGYTVSGIGVIMAVVSAAAGGLKQLFGQMGENIKEDIAAHAPAPEDWQNAAAANEMATLVQQQPTNNDPASPYYKPSVTPAVFSDGADSGGTMPTWENRGRNPDDATGDTLLNDVKTEEGVTVTSEGKSSNTMLWIGGAVVAAMLLSSSKKNK
jgi:hypothetical protein